MTAMTTMKADGMIVAHVAGPTVIARGRASAAAATPRFGQGLSLYDCVGAEPAGACEARLVAVGYIDSLVSGWMVECGLVDH